MFSYVQKTLILAQRYMSEQHISQFTVKFFIFQVMWAKWNFVLFWIVWMKNLPGSHSLEN